MLHVHAQIWIVFNLLYSQRDSDVNLWVNLIPRMMKNLDVSLYFNNWVFFQLALRSYPRYSGGLWKQRFHNENTFKFSANTTLEELQNTTILGLLDFCWRKTQSGKSHGYSDDIVFKMFRLQNVFHPYIKMQCQHFQMPSICRVFSKSSVFVMG